jgi:hypothetical protein
MIAGGRVATALARPPEELRGRRDEVLVTSARHRLNAAYASGSLSLAALIGGAVQSMTVFVVTLVALLILDLVAGNIRPKVR